MDLSSYLLLQTFPRDVLYLIWKYIRPHQQRKLSMMCRKFHTIFYEINNRITRASLPDLNSLLPAIVYYNNKITTKHTIQMYNDKIDSWLLWINEAKKCDNDIFRWRWIWKWVSVEIYFQQILVTSNDVHVNSYLITKIRVQYKISRDKSYSFIEFCISSRVKMAMATIGYNSKHGPKYRDLPKDDICSLLYVRLADTIKPWLINSKIRNLLNPVCHDISSARSNFNLNEMTFKIHIGGNLVGNTDFNKPDFMSLKCNKCFDYSKI